MPRVEAAKLLLKAIKEKKSLTLILRDQLQNHSPEDRGLIQELCYGVIRWYQQLDYIASKLLSKPLKQKDQDIYLLILIGLYQLIYTRIPPHAALSETVAAARDLGKDWATGLINAILRNYLRKQEQLTVAVKDNEVATYAHPQWLITKLKATWPNWREVLTANNSHPALVLRVNLSKISREDYLLQLHKAGIKATPLDFIRSAILIDQPVPIHDIPGFPEGFVSVQDGSAQLAAELLQPCPQDRVLDACAAPGGKTCHLLELQPEIREVIALDDDKKRLERLTENLVRLKLAATIKCSDATQLDWWDNQPFQKILLDAPCSATGVINRHPDIKLLRQPADVQMLQELQLEILNNLWKTLETNSILLYVTCSILPEENWELVERFMRQHPDCQEEMIAADWGKAMPVGRQILPGMYRGMDGFYFAKLIKTNATL